MMNLQEKPGHDLLNQDSFFSAKIAPPALPDGWMHGAGDARDNWTAITTKTGFIFTPSNSRDLLFKSRQVTLLSKNK